MHDVLHYDGGSTIRVTPLLRHSLAFTLPHQQVRCIIAYFFDMVLGGYSGPLWSTISRGGCNILVRSTLLVAGGGICLRLRRRVGSCSMCPTMILLLFVDLAIVFWFRWGLSSRHMLIG
jgi:hypothetical protein